MIPIWWAIFGLSSCVWSLESNDKKTVSILLDLGRESDCNAVESDVALEALEVARQRAEAAQWTMQRLVKLNSSSLGLRIIDTCGNKKLTAWRVMSLAAEYNLIDFIANNASSKFEANFTEEASEDEEEEHHYCQNRPPGFILMSSFVQAEVRRSLEEAMQPRPTFFWPPHEPLYEEQGALLALIKRLRWSQMILLLDRQPSTLQQSFNEAAARESICIVSNIVISTNKSNDINYGNNAYQIRERLKKAGSNNVVLVSPDPARVLGALNDTMVDLNWIVSRPRLTEIKPPLLLIHEGNGKGTPRRPPRPLYVMQNEFLRAPEFIQHYRNLSSHTSKSAEDNDVLPFIRTFLGLLDLASTEASLCRNFTLPSENEARQRLELSLQERKMRVYLGGQDIGHYHHVGGGLHLDGHYHQDVLPGQEEAPGQCREPMCQCQNINPKPVSNELEWRFDTWVTIMATLGAIGIVASICLAFFLSCKLCTEVLEASQTTSLLLLFAITLAYASFLPYGFHPTETICPLRTMATRLAFVFIFSVLLSRSIMLATADLDGLPGHISGGIQFILLFFMMAVEVALVSQEWWQTKEPYTTRVIIGGGSMQRLECRYNGSSKEEALLTRMSYIMVLLASQLLLSPFIVRSPRNYKEGLLFTCAAVACLFVWIGWTSAYVLLGDEAVWRDVAIAGGLITTPTVLILVVFVPKCYMVSNWRRRSFKGAAEVSLRGLQANSGSHDLVLSRTASSRLSHAEDVNNMVIMGHDQDTVTHNSLAAIGSTLSLYDSLKEGRHRGHHNQQHLPIATAAAALHPPEEDGRQQHYRSSLYGGGGLLHNKSRPQPQLPQFLAAGLPCDSPERRAMASEYPTYKLDQNTVVDNSISWHNAQEQPRTNNRLV